MEPLVHTHTHTHTHTHIYIYRCIYIYYLKTIAIHLKTKMLVYKLKWSIKRKMLSEQK